MGAFVVQGELLTASWEEIKSVNADWNNDADNIINVSDTKAIIST